MAEVRLKRLWFVEGQRFKKSVPGGTTTVPDELVRRNKLPPDAVVVDIEDIPDVDPDDLETPSEAAERALREAQGKEKGDLGMTPGHSNAQAAAASATAEAEEKRRLALENAKKRAKSATGKKK